ncbi:MAG: L-aspartate oxidase [Chloroflexota bacterium]
MKQYDYIVIGSGIAGLYCALLAQEHGTVLIFTKGSIEDCNTRYAQGGIAAPVGSDDSPDLHMQDTLAAGDGLCDPHAVAILTREAGDRIQDLIRYGVPFDTLYGEIALTREGAHSVSRVLHAGGDATGKHIELTLAGLARMSRVTIMEYCLATEILVEEGSATGVLALDCHTGLQEEYRGRFTVLATGGAGCLFRYTTNPEVATGDGVALAFRAGAHVTDMEFFQFHPTALRLPGAPPFLISEAIRGEGGILRNIHGEAFMAQYHPQGELAPRDVVARSMVEEMRRTGNDHVLLDVTHFPGGRVPTRFPSIYRFCLEHGLDVTQTPIPVAPAAHYMIGGVKTNTWGETNIRGLFACGEVASAGVHGANRLASNSLLESLVFGNRVVERTLAVENPSPEEPRTLEETLYTLPVRHPSEYPPTTLANLQSLAWSRMGILRDGPALDEAAATLASWQHALPEPQDRSSHELCNLVLVGRLLAEAALLREESRGAHFRTDFPQASPYWRRRIVLFCPR